jgi:probable HAF family extracellular repeat protein
MTIRPWLLLLPALLLPRPAAGQVYKVVDLGIGDPYFPTALNNRGQILLTNNHLTPASIGAALAAGGSGTWVGAASVLWDNGATSAIGLLPGGTYSRGCGLNDAGQVAGFGDTLWKFPGPVNGSLQVLHAFVWQGGGLTDLEPKITVDDGETTFEVPIGSFATGINNQGEVTGGMTAQAPDPDDGAVIHAFRTPPGGQSDHDADDISAGDPSFTRGWLINNAGTVLGWRSGPDGGGRAYVLYGGGAVPPADAAVYAMNDSGAMVGVEGGRAFASGVPGGLPSSLVAALGINNHGQIVGQGEIGDALHAVLFSNGQLIDLNERLPAGSGWELSQAAFMNDRGQMVVWGSHNGHSALGLLTPDEGALTLSFQPGSVCRGDTATGLIRLGQPAGTDGLLVQLSGDPPLPDLPLGVTVPAGQSEKSFTVPVSGPPGTVYQVTASIPSGSGLASAQAPLEVTRPQLQSLALADQEISSDDKGAGTVTLTCPAPPGGTPVTLAVEDPRQLDRLAAPETVMVPEGESSARFTLSPTRDEVWRTDVLFTVKASAGGASQSQDLTVRPTIRSFYTDADPVLGVMGEIPVTGTITLSLPAPAGGREVQVISSNPAVAMVGGGGSYTAMVPAGQQTVAITIQTQRVTAPAPVEVTARTATSEVSARFNVVP